MRVRGGPGEKGALYGERNFGREGNGADALTELGGLLKASTAPDRNAVGYREEPPLHPSESPSINIDQIQHAVSVTRVRQMALIALSLTYGEMMKGFVEEFFRAADAADKNTIEITRDSLARIFNQWSENAQTPEKGAEEEGGPVDDAMDAGTARANAPDS